MKIPRIVLVSAILLLGGCVLVPSPYSDQLDPIAQRYSSVKVGILRAQLEAELGAPNLEEKDGPCVWETRIDERNYAMLRVWFGDDDGAQKLEITRAHGQIFPHYQASAVSTRIK